MDIGQKSSHPIDYWNIIRRRRWAVILCVSVFLPAVILRTVLTQPIYRATVQVQIERENPNILPFQGILTDGGQFDDFYETQYQLMKSRNVARRVLVEIGKLPPPLSPEPTGPARAAAARAVSPGSIRSPHQGEEEDASVAENRAIDALLSDIQVVPTKKSRLVKIHALSTDPVLAARIANSVADSYVAFITNEKFSTTERAADGLRGQIEQVNFDLGQKEQEFQRYAIANDIVALSDKTNATMQRFDDLNVDYTKAIAARIEAESRWRTVRDAPPDSFREVLQSDLIKDLQTNVSRLEGEYGQLARTFKPGWPALERKREELATAKRMQDEARASIVGRVRAGAERDFRIAADHEASLRAEVEKQKKEIQELNLKKVRYDSLKAELDSKRQIFGDLVTRQNQTGVSSRVAGVAGGNVRIVDRAEVPNRMYRPNRLLIILIGALLGLVLGVGAAFALESIDNSVKSLEDLQNILQKPALGVIPAVGTIAPSQDKTQQKRDGSSPRIELAATQPHSPAAEAYRDLRTSVMLSAAGSPPRTLLVTSSRPGEGKTATAINLAVTLSQIDRRVLLVDCDLRRPRIHKVLDLPRHEGLSNYLSSAHMPLESILVPTEVPNLFAVVSGPIPPNPAELLASERFGHLIAEATSGPGSFDHIIFDSSPLLSVADPVILASRIETAILVVDAGSTPKGALIRARDKLLQTRVNLIGAVLNRVDPGSDSYYDYYVYRYGRYRNEPETTAPPHEERAARRARGGGRGGRT